MGYILNIKYKRIKWSVIMEMEEIDLAELFNYFLKRVFIIVITALVFLVGGLIYTVFLKEPLYKSDVNIILVSKNSQSSSLQSDIAANQKLAATYRELVTSRSVLNEVIEDLDLTYTVGQLQKMISVENVNETEIIKIAVSSSEPKEAKEIANVIAVKFQDEVKDIYNLENVSIIDKAVIAKEPYNINVVKESIIYIALGVVLSCGVIFVIYYFDNTIKSIDQVEKRLGIPVIGTVPIVGKKDK
jgi:capsular polysaccharide biosynthesis protein